MLRDAAFRRALLAVALLSALILGLGGLVLGWGHSRMVERGRHDELEKLAAALQKAFAGDPGLFTDAGRREAATTRVKEAAGASGVRVTVFGKDGKALADSAGEEFPVGGPAVTVAIESGSGLSRGLDPGSKIAMDYAAAADPKSSAPVVRVGRPTAEIVTAADAAMTSILVGAAFAWLSITGIASMALFALWSREASLRLFLNEPKANDPHLAGVLGDVGRRTRELLEQHRTVSQDRSHERTEAGALLSAMSEAVLSVDRDNRIRLVNAAAGRLLAIDTASASGKSMASVVRAEGIAELAARAASGRQEVGRIEVPGPPARILEVHAEPIRETGGAVVVLRDVTEEARFAEMRRDFVASASHELRTPISVVRGMVETLLDGALEQPKQAREFLEAIERQVKSLNALVNDLLDLGKLESRPEFTPRAVEIRAVLDSAVAIHAETAKKKGIAVQVDCDDVLPRLMADTSLLERAFSNLVDNAIRYTPSGGQVRATATAEGDRVRVEIRDTGIGVPEKDLKRIFERFYRVDKSRSRDAGGTGLGLAIVKHIVNLHKGEVWAEGAPGGGAVFIVRLPGFGI